MISARDVTKLFGRTAAVTEASFEVAAGDGVALCGPRASGKTTLLRLLASWLEPSSGTIQIGGFDARTHLWQARSRISYAASDAVVGTGLSVEEYVRFVTRVRSRTAPSTREPVPVEEALGLAQLTRSARVHTLSSSQRATLALVAALAVPADAVLIDRALDELDVAPREAFSQRLLEARSRGAALVVVTEDPDQLSGLCNRMLRMKDGQVIEVAWRG